MTSDGEKRREGRDRLVGWRKIVAATVILSGICVQPTYAAQDGGGGQSQYYVEIKDPSVLVGRYHFQEEELAIDVDLNGDHTALYTVSADGGQGGIRAEGLWRVDGEDIHIYNDPRPGRLDRAEPSTIDPGVTLAVVATQPDGSPAEGLALTWKGATGPSSMSAGRYTAATNERQISGTVSILRLSDGKKLASFIAGPGLSNSHRFIYRPIPSDPFDIKAAALDARAEMIMVEAGSAGAPLHRVRD